MGFPVITRLGVNQFWYKHWYNDFSYSKYFMQTRLAEDSINIYFSVGVHIQTSLSLHKYWSLKHIRHSSYLKIQGQKNLYFRQGIFENRAFNVKEYYDVRLDTGEFFPMRNWIFRYNQWVIFCIFWFKPLKIKYKNFNKNSSPLDSQPGSYYTLNNEYKFYFKKFKILSKYRYNFF